MVYSFLNFIIDTDSKELSTGDTVIPLTRQNFNLLLLFVSNPKKVFSKDDIIDEVWAGRYVSGNTIDQSVSKLRKILNSVKQDTYIQTAYGRGFKFVPEVSCLDSIQQVSKKPFKHYILLAFFVVIIPALYMVYDKVTQEKPPESLLMIVTENASDNDVWFKQASATFLGQVFGYANAVTLKDFSDKPEYMDRQQYFDNQWKISSDFNIVTANVVHRDGLFDVKLILVDKNQKQQAKLFSHQSLSVAMKHASKWLAREINQTSSLNRIDSLIPDDSYVIELYMRGLTSLGKGEFDKAEHFFQLCIEESPNFYLARLQQAKVKRAQGKPEKSLAILDTLSKLDIYPQIEIEITAIRGDIYDTQGKYELARDLYLSILEKYKDKPVFQLNDIRYNLSFTYTVLTKFDKALAELNKLETNIYESKNPELLASVLHKKASILQKLGHMQQAQQSAEKALALYSKLEDLLGEAKVYSILARISSHQSKYKESIQYLNQALGISKSLDYKLGIGASLNDLIYVLMVQGEFSNAWQANIEMQKIAIAIDYKAMLLVSKQYAVDISRAQKKWKRAGIYLQEHLQLAQASNNKSALLKNKLLALDLYLDEKKLNKVKTLIGEVQEYIDSTGEIRLQARIDKKLARYYLLSEKYQQGVGLLLSSKEMAKKTDDTETIIEINNLLAEQYLQSNQIDKAMAVLEESSNYNPLPYPYLLLKSKLQHALGKPLKALDLANECKRRSNQWWSLEDERYLTQLKP
ncbi:MAG: winged helix-turn-helix domain-containing protein [Proteobacteria bacterium]|nr:winged helix-turn-helix domain-containing protein [Pseudomonadota bacterium]